MKPIKTLRKFSLLLIVLWLCLGECKAQQQSLDSLNHLEGTQTKTYYSDGAKQIANSMATRCDKVMSYYKSHLESQPTVTLLVLSPEDWSAYTKFPFYGMPHYNGNQTLIVASEDNEFWKSQMPPLEQLPSELERQISNVYGDANNSQPSLQAFFNLLAIHELGHAFTIQGGLKMQRKWMGELFPNILLHAYIAENEPELLPALTLFPIMTVTLTRKADLSFTTLPELETNYGIMGPQHPKNYAWYQCRWHMAAANIYDEGGITAVKNLWKALKTHQDPLDDAAFTALLSDVHESVANVQLKWDD